MQQKLNALESWLVDWGYRAEIVQLEIRKVNSIDRNVILAKRRTVLFAFDPALHVTLDVVKSAHRHIENYSTEAVVFHKKGTFKNITKFTGKHLCQSLFVNKFAGMKP